MPLQARPLTKAKALTLLGLTMPALAGAAPQPEASLDWVSFYTRQQVRQDSPYNPDNRLAQLPDSQAETVLRGRLRWQPEPFVLAAAPRVGYRRDFHCNCGGETPANTRDDYHYLQSWQLEVRSATLGAFYTRELRLWGPSLFASPSNPFFVDTNQVNPFRELPARDFVGARWQINDQFALTALRNVAVGRDTEILRSFKPINALLLEHTAQDHAAGVVASERAGRWRLGLFGQYTVNDATLLYTDAAFFRDNRRLVATEDTQLQPREGRRTYADLVAGVAHTLESGATINAELRRNGEAYSREEQRRMGRYADFHAARFRQGDAASSGASAGALGAVVQPHASTWGRNHLYLQWLDRRSVERTSFVVQATHAFDTRETSLTGVVTREVGDRLRLSAIFTLAGGRSGSEAGEYRRYLDRALFIGATLAF